jgi:hypothetical protein
VTGVQTCALPILDKDTEKIGYIRLKKDPKGEDIYYRNTIMRE